MSDEPGRLGPALLLALLAASLVLGALVHRARTPDLALEVPRIERVLRLGEAGEGGAARIRFFVRFDDDEASVQVVGAERRPVRTLYEGPLTADREVVCEWDGRGDDGDLVAPDDYRLRVVLPGEDRDMIYPRRIFARSSQAADERESPAASASACRLADEEAAG